METHQYEDGTEVAVTQVPASELHAGDEIPGHTGPHKIRRLVVWPRVIRIEVRDDKGHDYTTELDVHQEVRVIV